VGISPTHLCYQHLNGLTRGVSIFAVVEKQWMEQGFYINGGLDILSVHPKGGY
jgi:hypothetical protein